MFDNFHFDHLTFISIFRMGHFNITKMLLENQADVRMTNYKVDLFNKYFSDNRNRSGILGIERLTLYQ